MSRTSDSVKIHIRLITAMVNKLLSDGYTVSADHIGYPNGRPDAVRGYIPDIFAKKGEEKIYIEAETCDSLESTETRLQWIALSSDSVISFSVIVPKKCLDDAKKLANKWDVKIKTFWSMDV